MPGSRTPLVLVLTVAMLAAVAPATSADSHITFETRELSGEADAVVVELATDEGFQTLEGTTLTAHAAFLSDVQRLAIVGGLVQDGTETSCPNDDGGDPCSYSMSAFTAEDLAASSQPDHSGDLRLDTGPGLDVQVETGHDHLGYTGVWMEIDISHRTLPADDGTSYHLSLAAPGAAVLDAELRLTARGDVQIADERLVDGGFLHGIEDMRAAGAHSAAGNAYVGSDLACGQGCGEIDVDPGQGRLYAGIGPSQAGSYTIHADPTGNYCEGCLGPIPATFAGTWGYDSPSTFVSFTGAGVVGTAPPSSAVVTLAGAGGETTFFVDRYVSIGPQDLVAAGFVDPG
jgi:hypothetical protein